MRIKFFKISLPGLCCLLLMAPTMGQPDVECPLPPLLSCEYSASSCGSSFQDISGTGTLAATASSSDDDGDVVPLGISFDFFGDSKTNIGVASNGYLTFGPDVSDFTNDPIPSATDPNDLIAPLWDDWAPLEGGNVHYETTATPSFIAQWTDVPHFDVGGASTFQAELFEGSNCIEFRYDSFVNAIPTVGVENADGSAGTSVDPTTISSGDCIELCPSCGETNIVQIDVKPGSNPNCTNTGSKGKYPVAVLGSDTLDVADIDQTTIEFGGASPHKSCKVENVNGDGYPDLICHFKTQQINWPDFSLDPSGCAEVGLVAELLDATVIQGADWVCEAGRQFCEDGTPTADCSAVSAEGEACGDDINGGCNSNGGAGPYEFGAISCGETVAGTAWADGGTRDTDWYAFSLTGETDIEITLVSEFEGLVIAVDAGPGLDCSVMTPLATGCADAGAPISSAQVTLQAGDYVVFVATGNCGDAGIFDGFACGGANDYTVTLDCIE